LPPFTGPHCGPSSLKNQVHCPLSRYLYGAGFIAAAKETADLLSKRIVLIDGHQLTRLMIRFDIGCRVEEVVYIKKLDEDFFD